MGFWWTIILVNISLFLPYYFLNFRSQPNPFSFLTSRSVSFGNKIKAVYYKVSSDPFRVFFEFTLLILLGHLFNWDGGFYLALCAFVGLFGWIIILYSGVMQYVFQRAPVLGSDWAFMKVGWKMNYNNRLWIITGLTLFIVMGWIGFFWLSRYLMYLEVKNNGIWYVLMVMTILALVKVNRIYYDRFIHRTVLSVVAYVWRNFKYSNRFQYLLDKEAGFFESLNDYRDLDLIEKPNIYLFSVESYGSVAFTNEDIFEALKDVYTEHENQFEEQGIYAASVLSEAPTSAGGSWNCYSSITYGLKIDSDQLYFMLFKSVPGFEHYDSIFHTFRRQGYRNYLLSPATNYIKGTVDWDLLKRNLQSDEMISWEDLEYKGKTVPFFGNCYAPPDQYSIDKAKEILDSQEDKPYVLFYSTLNSHYPFVSPTEVVDDIGELHESMDFDILDRKSSDWPTRYTKSIRYQLEVLFRFVQRTEEGIFVLFGDHQPPRITQAQDGMTTPLHVFTKSKHFHHFLVSHGFEKGLIPDIKHDHTIRHEGFYSLFMKGIYRIWNRNPEIVKNYHPNGRNLEA